MTVALLPLKDLVEAKTRLSGLLRPSQRRALAQAMAEDVLDVLADSRLVDRIVMVSDDSGARLLAREFGAECWPESELGCRGLNPVLGRAAQRLAQTARGPVVVLHADIPLLCADDLAAVMSACADEQALVVGPDRHGTGTNLLAFDAARVPRFSFGSDSCAAHGAQAVQDGRPVCILRRPGIGLDVDEPADLAQLLAVDATGRGRRTLAYLNSDQLGSGLRLALGSLEVDRLFLREGEERAGLA